jgi:hypothetical protein
MPNRYEQLRMAIGLKPEPIQIVTVVAHEGSGQSRVEFDGGAQRLVYGQSVDVDDKAYLQGDKIIGAAPDSVLVEVEV